MTFPSSLDVFVFSLLWTGVLLSISHRKYNIPPSIVQEPQLANCRAIDCEQGDKVTIYFKEDEPIEISCVASGRPNVTYKWTKDDQDFEVGSDSRIKILPNSGTLFISNASQTDHGLYQCFATNSLGTSLSKKATVIFAINEVFKSVIRPEEIQANEGLPISLKCNVPYVVPKPSVYWTNVGRFDVDPLASRVSLSERIVLDYEGTLHFAHIRATDIKQNGKFICNMHNNIYRTYSEGEDKKVKVIKSKMTSPVKLLWKSNQIVEGLKGGEATFMCVFGGNPTPVISWKRKDKPMNDRMRISATGHELIITELDISDSGYYECSGINDLTTQPVIVTFELTVEALPYFVKAPSDVTIGVQEDAEFPCMVEGIPKPDVQWLVNGIPIEDTPPNPRRIVQKNRIVFKNVSKDDSQVLQCTATNKHGSTMMDVYLNVLALKPEITSGPGSKKVAEGKSVTLSCEHNGKPTPKLSWKKSTQILTGDTYTFSHNSIFIKNATLNDDGPYTCMATNMFGTAVEDGSLTVRKKTTVSVHPVERLLRNGEGATFACIALTDPAEKPNLVITWYKNGEELKANQEEGIRIVGDSLQIRKTRSKDSGNYTCHADNGIDNASAVSQLKVEAKPEVPKSLLLKTCGNLKAGLIWQPGFDNYLKITSFHIYGKSTYDKDYILMKDLTGNYTQWELDVTPYANYTFKITAKNLLGESLMSEPTNVCTTKEFPPSHHPKNVKIIDNKTGKLVIEWDAIKPKEQNGPGFKYIIYTTHLKSGKKKSYEVTDWDTTKKEIDVDNTYEQYKVEVKAQNVKGDATDKSYIYRGHSGMGVPTEVPGNFEVDPDEPFSHEAISFRWDPVDTSDTAMKGKFAGYRIRYWNSDEPDKMKEIDIPVSTPKNKRRRRRRETEDQKVRARVRLPPYSDLQLDVVARNTYFDSNSSNVINVTTPEGVPDEVEHLEALTRSGHFIKIKWQKPLMANGELIGYDVEYEEIHGLGVGSNSYPVDLEPVWNQDNNRYELGIRGLELDTNYRIHVWAKTKTGRGKENYIDVKTAVESLPTQPTIAKILPGKNFMNVSWEINKSDVAGYCYQVEYRVYGQHQYTKGPEEKLNTWSIIQNLTEATTYEIIILAKSGKYESRSEKQTVSTLGKAAVANAVYEATWFIIMMVVLALLLLILIIVCLVKRSRGDKYHVQEKEKLRGLEHDEKKTAQYNGFNDNGETQPLAGSPDDYDRGPLESDKDSLEEYADPDPSRFNEDGSFIGQYGAEKMTASEVAVPSAMHTFV